MEPTTADGSPLVVRGSYIPIEWSIFQWPPSREVSLAYIARKLSDPALHGVSATSIMMMSSDDECHQAAKRIEEEAFNACADDSGLPAFNAYADEPAQIDSALPAFRDYWSKIREAIITTVKSRGPPSPNPPRDFIPMEETEPKVYHDRDENDRNDEVDNKKKAKLLEEGGAKSRPAPQEGMVRRDFVIFKKPYSTGPPVSFEDSHRGFYKHLLRKKPKPTTLPDDGHPPPGPSPPVSAKNFICGQTHPIDLSDDEESHVANLLASEAVKEYNNRQFEDKLELVKVTKGTGSGVAGHLFNLTFDAKVLGDGGGGTTKSYQAKVWLKIDGTLQVISFKLTDDGQGKEVVFWERR